MLERLDKDARSGVLKLLVAFFFDESKDFHGEGVYEFTHRSFAEFLVARRLIRKIRDIDEEFRRSETSSFQKGWSIETCLVEWAGIAGFGELDPDLLRFVTNEESKEEGHEEYDYYERGEWVRSKANGKPVHDRLVEFRKIVKSFQPQMESLYGSNAVVKATAEGITEEYYESY